MQDVELTEDETLLALIDAKRQKRVRQQFQEREQRAEENRKKLTNSQWDAKQTEGYMLYRAGSIFPTDKPFVLDQHNRVIFKLLCQYFSNDVEFVSVAANMGVAKPSLDKGIMLLGNFGVGKTWLMKLFSKNQRQVFQVMNAKDIAEEFSADGTESRHVDKVKNCVNDVSCFYQPFSGLCLDDLGTEDIKNHFGNKKNVVGDLIEKRYSRQNTGIYLHATTNLTTQQVTDFYGGRVLSRMYEIFNFIELKGEDRRK